MPAAGGARSPSRPLAPDPHWNTCHVPHRIRRLERTPGAAIRAGARHRPGAARRLRPALRAVPRLRARGASATSRPATGSRSGHVARDRIDFYDRRVQETAERIEREFRCARPRRRRRRRAVGAGQAPLHRAPDRPPAARVRRDVLQLGVVQDPAPRPTSTTASSSCGRRCRPSTSTPIRRPTAATTRCSRACAHALIDIVLDFRLRAPLRRLPPRPAQRARARSARACRGRSGSRRTTRSRCCRRLFFRNQTAYVVGPRRQRRARRTRSSCAIKHDADGQALRRRAADGRARARAPVLGEPRLLPGRHGGAVGVRRLPARDRCRTRPRPSSTRWSGCRRHGKKLFFRDFLHHLKHSRDQFIVAPGIKGLVMTRVHAALVPVRVQGDQGQDRRVSKDTDRARVKQKYALVKHHDRVGRMTDILEYSDVAFPRERFSRRAARRSSHDGRALAGRGRRRPRRRPAPLHRAADDAAQPLPRAAPTTRSATHAIARVRRRAQGARRRQHLRRRPAVQELRRHALRPRRVLRLRRDRVPGRLRVPADPAAAARATTTCRATSGIRSGRTTSFPEEFETFLLTDPQDARVLPVLPRRPARRRAGGRATQEELRSGRPAEVLSYSAASRLKRAEAGA